jgi:hypothetical protein
MVILNLDEVDVADGAHLDAAHADGGPLVEAGRGVENDAVVVAALEEPDLAHAEHQDGEQRHRGEDQNADFQLVR